MIRLVDSGLSFPSLPFPFLDNWCITSYIAVASFSLNFLLNSLYKPSFTFKNTPPNGVLKVVFPNSIESFVVATVIACDWTRSSFVTNPASSTEFLTS